MLLLQGMTLLMMGSAEALPAEPAVRPMFVEDMTEEQLASAVSKSLTSTGSAQIPLLVAGCFFPPTVMSRTSQTACQL